MEKRNNYTSIFVVFFILCLVSFGLYKIGTLNFLSGLVSQVFSSPRGLGISAISQNNNLSIVKIAKDLDEVKLQKENQALRDQFAVSSPSSSNLLPAKIIGAPTFIPSVTVPDEFILNRGEKDGVRVGQAVVVENNLIGEILEVNSFASKVMLVNNKAMSLTGKIDSGAVGVARGLGDNLEIGNILLSEDLNKNGLVYTKGNQNLNGIGLPPDLIVGKIFSVEKDPSALFQKAEVRSLVDFSKINMVFIVIK